MTLPDAASLNSFKANIWSEFQEQGCLKTWLLSPFQTILHKGWLALAKLKPLSLFISLLLILKEAFDNVTMQNRLKWTQ